MVRQNTLWFYPERITWIGAAVLGGCLALACPLLFLSRPSLANIQTQGEKETVAPSLEFSLGLSEEGPRFSVPDFLQEMGFFLHPPRPDKRGEAPHLLIRLKKSGDSKQVSLPCRIDLERQGDRWMLSKEPSSFWLELAAGPENEIEGHAYISSPEEGKKKAGTFVAKIQEYPTQNAQEFPATSPFRILAEAHWWGRDLLRQCYEVGTKGERLEIGGQVFELGEGDWLVWKEGLWQKSREPEQQKPIAHLQSATSKGMILEGWDDGYARLSLSLASSPPFKMKGEELFSAIRIRSEKQISCMLEKQCMVLKTGDWVLKASNRWKILRKKEEREAFLSGKVNGELFVFEQIHMKQGQKVIQGRLFNQGRTQAVVIEMAAQSNRRDKALRKGKMP